jgi:hypothetical protein
MSLAAALLAFQAEAPTLSKNAAGQVGSRNYKYVDLHSIVETITPLLAKHGLTWTTRPTGTHDAPTLTYELLWEGDGSEVATDDTLPREAIAGEMPLYLPEHPTSQTLGSAITYARRYALTAVLNLVADEDDDGQAATSAPAKRAGFKSGGGPSDGQRAEIKRQVKSKDVSRPQLKIMLDTIGVEVTNWANWMEFLTPGRDGSASALISWFKERPIPTGESDVPADDAPQHEKVPQDDTLPFS